MGKGTWIQREALSFIFYQLDPNRADQYPIKIMDLMKRWRRS